jgi:hypothetical protein
MIHPIARIMMNPIIFGIAARKRARAWAIEVKIASPQSRTGTGTMAAFLRAKIEYRKTSAVRRSS